MVSCVLDNITDVSNLELFMYTIEEYLRFTSQLPINTNNRLTDQYDESEYIAIQTRLMLLRKYTSKGKKNNVYFENVISEAIKIFPHSNKQLEQLNEEFNKTMQQQIEHILSDGTKLNIYETIETTMYGLYLHADADKIRQINKTHESIRFTCTRKYVTDVEKVILQLYETLKELGVTSNNLMGNTNQAPVLYLGDSKSEKQNIQKSSYWSNLYGHDATDDEIKNLVKGSTIEELLIFNTCLNFLDELKKSPIPIKILKKLVHPSTVKEWGDFSDAQKFYFSINNPGLSNTVRYSEDKTLAYMRILPNVEEAFVIDTPHVIVDLYEISLAKDFRGNWRVFSIGGHLDSKYKK